MRIAILLAAFGVGTASFLGTDGDERGGPKSVGLEEGRVSAATLAPMPSAVPSAGFRLRGRATSSGPASRWSGEGSSGWHAPQAPDIRPQGDLRSLALDLDAPDPVRRMHAIEALDGLAGGGVRLLLARAMARAESEIERKALQRVLASSRRRTTAGPGPGPLRDPAARPGASAMTSRPSTANELTGR